MSTERIKSWTAWIPRKGRKIWIPAGGLSLLLLLFLFRAGDDSAVDGMPSFKVARGPMTISVTETGTIKAKEQVELKSEVEGQTTIIFLVPEGKHVKKGDLLVELDASRLEDERIDQEIKVENSEAAYIRAREDLAVAENQAKSDNAQAKLDLEFAKEDLKKYIDGEYPKSLKQVQNDITLAEAELKQALDTMEWSQKLYADKYISKSEMDRDVLAHQRARLNSEIAEEELNLLKEYTNKRRVAELMADVEQNELALERVGRKTSADVVQAKAELRAKKAEWDRQQVKLEKNRDQLGKTKIFSPVDAMVVYATTGRGNWRGNAEPLEEGQTVREREELIFLPTASAKLAEIKIHESSLQMVRVGQPVRVTLAALPGRECHGTVAKISPLPDAQSLWLNPDLKVYSAQIDLKGDLNEVRTGMTCKSEILIEYYDDAVYVPVQAVVRIGDQPTVFVRNRSGMNAKPVELGLDNNRMVRILSGVEFGEDVILTPPLKEATKEIVQGDLPPLQAEGAWQASKRKSVGERETAATPDFADKPQQGVSLPNENGEGNTRPERVLGNLSPDQQKQMAEFRRRMRDATPEEREKLIERRRKVRSGAKETTEGHPG